jgi:arylsulfatase A-like enzyme
MVLGSACNRPPDEVVWRLVDSPSQAGDTPLEPDRAHHPRGRSRATINDDQRYVFERSEPDLIHRNQDFVVPAEDTVDLSVSLPDRLPPCTRVQLDISLGCLEATDHHVLVAECMGNGPARVAHVRFESAPVIRGLHTDLWVYATPIDVVPIRERRFHLPLVPRAARLLFSYGIEEPGWSGAATPVRFDIADDQGKILFTSRLDPVQNQADRRWHDGEVDLGAYAGRALTLVLRRVLEQPTIEAFTTPVWGNVTIVARGDGEHPAPWNVLLISLDTLRARSMSSYGNPRQTTPTIDWLASQGVLFEQTVAPSTTTPQSHMSMMTGLLPSAHGITDLTKGSDLTAYATLAEKLRSAGYITGAVTEDGMLRAALGFERGFDSYAENKASGSHGNVGLIETTFARAREWLERRGHVPFFLFVHTYQVHDPYTPPPGYAGRFGPLDTEGPQAELDRYEEEIRYTDDKVADLWAHVRELGLADQTILIVISDHGEAFGEHGSLRHGTDLYDETVLVPWIMRAPGLIPKGLRVVQPVGLIDLEPTLLDLLALPHDDHIQGTSLAPLWRSDPTQIAMLEDRLKDRPLYAEAWGGIRTLTDGSADEGWQPPGFGLRTSQTKVLLPRTTPVEASHRIEAYDLGSDPEERRDLFGEQHERFAPLAERLRAYAKDGATERPAAAGAPVPPPDAATAEKLRALGYVR